MRSLPVPVSALLQRAADRLAPAAQAVRPAVPRIGVGAFAVHVGLRRRPMLRALHRQEAERFRPVGVARVLRRPLPPRVADVLADAALVASGLAALGVAHRVTGPAAGALQLWTMTYRNSWGMIFHHDNQMVGHQIVLGLGPSADALSLDALLRGQVLPGRFDRRYGATSTAAAIVTVSVYLVSGVAKVRGPLGLRWATGGVLRDQIAADAVRKELFGTEPPRAAALLRRGRGPFGLLALTSLVVELGAPLALLDPRLGRAFAAGSWGMHAGIRVIMGIRFTYNLSGISSLPMLPVGPQLGR